MRAGNAFSRFKILASGKPPAPTLVGPWLQPVAYSPIAAWALLDQETGPTMGAASLVDRVSGAYPLTRPIGTVAPSPDLLKGYRCPVGGASSRPLGRDDRHGGGLDPILKFQGACTLSMRLWWRKHTTWQTVFDLTEGWGARNDPSKIQAFFRFSIHTDGWLNGYHQQYVGGYSFSDYSYTSTTVQLTRGRWQYVALRRSAAGRYTWTVDGVHETAPGDLPLPNTPTASGCLNIGQWGSAELSPGSVFAGSDPTLSGYADVMVWNKELTDAQINEQRRVMFGL